MIDIFFYILSFILTAPFVIAVIVYTIVRHISNNPLFAIHQTVSWTTILFIVSVNFLILEIFSKNILGYIIIFLLLILTIILIKQWRKNDEVLFIKAYRLVKRISFLLFVMTYILLVIGGITKEMLTLM